MWGSYPGSPRQWAKDSYPGIKTEQKTFSQLPICLPRDASRTPSHAGAAPEHVQQCMSNRKPGRQTILPCYRINRIVTTAITTAVTGRVPPRVTEGAGPREGVDSGAPGREGTTTRVGSLKGMGAFVRGYMRKRVSVCPVRSQCEGASESPKGPPQEPAVWAPAPGVQPGELREN